MQVQLARRMSNVQASAIREILKVAERPDVLVCRRTARAGSVSHCRHGSRTR